jgi:hypothetical protein
MRLSYSDWNMLSMISLGSGTLVLNVEERTQHLMKCEDNALVIEFTVTSQLLLP